MDQKLTKLFVYDTFLDGEKDHHIISNSKLLRSNVRLYGHGIIDCGEYPELCRCHKGYVTGDIYEVDSQVLERICAIYLKRKMVMKNVFVRDSIGKESYDVVTFSKNQRIGFPCHYLSNFHKWSYTNPEEYVWCAVIGPLMSQRIWREKRIGEELEAKCWKRTTLNASFYFAGYSLYWKSSTAYLKFDVGRETTLHATQILMPKKNVKNLQRLLGTDYNHAHLVNIDKNNIGVFALTTKNYLRREKPSDSYMKMMVESLEEISSFNREEAICYYRFSKDLYTRSESESNNLASDAKHILNVLNSLVVGNEETKKQITGILLKSRMRGEIKHSEGERPIVVAIEGPSGSGKTALAEAIAKATDRPFIQMDASTITNDVYSASPNIGDAFINTKYSIDQLEHAVVFLDEFDKCVADPKYSLENQTAFLKFFDGGEISINAKKSNYGETRKLSAANMLILVGGTFRVGIDQDLTKTNAGFVQSAQSVNEESIDLRTRMKKLGFIDEIIGRITEHVTMERLSEESITGFLEKASSVLGKFSAQIKQQTGTTILLDDSAKKIIAKSVMSSKYGMRELNYRLQPLFSRITFDLSINGTQTSAVTIYANGSELTYQMIDDHSKKNDNNHSNRKEVIENDY